MSAAPPPPQGRRVARPIAWLRLGVFVAAASALGGTATTAAVAYAAAAGAVEEVQLGLQVASAALFADLAVGFDASVIRIREPP